MSKILEAPAKPWKVLSVKHCSRSGLRFEGQNLYFSPDDIDYLFYWGHDSRRAPAARYDFSEATFEDAWCEKELARRQGRNFEKGG